SHSCRLKCLYKNFVTAPSIPSINYKPSADCAYSMLVNKIKNRQVSFTTNSLQQPPVPGTADHGIPMQYHQLAMEATAMTTDHIIQASPVLYRNDPAAANPAVYRPVQQPVYVPVQTSAAVQKTSYNGDSSDEEHFRIHGGSASSESSRPTSPAIHENFILPPRDVQLIIDKMASYVAKNGRDFESIVRSKGDSRFSFLDANHAYFAYYQHKVGLYEKLEAPVIAAVPANKMDVDDSSQDLSLTPGAGEDSHDGSEKSSDGSRNDAKLRPKPAPVCFSIKKPKESEAMLLEKRSALPIEESTDEEEGQEGEEKEKKEKEKKSEEKKKVEESTTKDEGKSKDKTETIQTISSHLPNSNSGNNEDNSNVKDSREKRGSVDKDKWAEERVKDKLAAAAREKIAAAAREKQLQLERKRRAAAFINMIRKDHPLGTPERTVIGPLLPDGAPVQRLTDDEGEVSSVPSPTSFSDVTSPQRMGNGNQDVEDRLNPKENEYKQSTLCTYIWCCVRDDDDEKVTVIIQTAICDHSRSRSRSHSHTQTHSRGTDKHRHKRKKISISHKRSLPSSSPHSHMRSHRPRKEVEHLKLRKSKKKTRSRSRSRSRSHHSKSHYHSSSEKSSSRMRHGSVDAHSNKKSHHKKSKKSSRSSDRSYYPFKEHQQVQGPVEVMDPSLLLRPEPAFAAKPVGMFRDYTEDPEDPIKERVRQTYLKMHTYQTVDFVRGKMDYWLRFDKFRSPVMDALVKLNDLVDESDPDVDIPNLVHAFQTAERIRADHPEEDWFHLTGLIHDLGKIMAFYGEPQWAVVGDTFVVGYGKNPLYNTKYGMYQPNCGLENVTLSWGHDEFLYQVLKHNKTTLPEEALYMIRFHSFYPWHSGGDYTHLTSEKDKKILPWVLEF
ncbi:hypothetical protein L9F63_017208, partial [Diploptera punctata]